MRYPSRVLRTVYFSVLPPLPLCYRWKSILYFFLTVTSIITLTLSSFFMGSLLKAEEMTHCKQQNLCCWEPVLHTEFCMCKDFKKGEIDLQTMRYEKEKKEILFFYLYSVSPFLLLWTEEECLWPQGPGIFLLRKLKCSYNSRTPQ